MAQDQAVFGNESGGNGQAFSKSNVWPSLDCFPQVLEL